MYSSPGERTAGIEQGSRLPGHDLTAWLHRSADALEEAMARLSDRQWQVRTRRSHFRSFLLFLHRPRQEGQPTETAVRPDRDSNAGPTA